MKTANYAKMLSCAVVILGQIYMPEAMATTPTQNTFNLFTIPVPDASVSVGNNSVQAGSFEDTYIFKVSANAIVSGNFSSNFITYVNPSLNNPFGKVQLTDVQLVDTTTHTTLDFAVTDTLKTPGVPASYSDSVTTFTNVHLSKNDTYYLNVYYIGGSSLKLSNPSFYHGTLILSSAPVPEPEAWAMLLLGIPLVGWLVRRRQACIEPLRYRV